jgi:F-box-like
VLLRYVDINDLPMEIVQRILTETALLSTINQNEEYEFVLSKLALVCTLWHSIVYDKHFRVNFTERLLRAG